MDVHIAREYQEKYSYSAMHIDYQYFPDNEKSLSPIFQKEKKEYRPWVILILLWIMWASPAPAWGDVVVIIKVILVIIMVIIMIIMIIMVIMVFASPAPAWGDITFSAIVAPTR